MNEDNYALKEDESSLNEHCEHVQDILEDKKVKEAILKGEKEISALLKASRAVLQYSDFKISSKAIFDACTELIGAPAGYVALLTPDRKENQVVFLNTGEYICTVDPDLSMPIRGMRGEVVKSKKPLYNNNFPETDWLRFMPKGHGYLENVLFTPLLIDDEVQGLMGMANKPGGFTEEDVKLAMAFTEYVSIALQNSQMLESLEDSEQRYKNLSQKLEQKVIERTKELKLSEEKFSKAFHSSPNLMAITRMEDGYFIEVNDTYIQTLGYSREELIGHTSVKLNLWANPRQRSEFTKRLTEDKKVKSFDVDVYTKSGKILTILFSGDIIYLNNIPHLITSASDITEYRIAEQKVKESEEKYRSLFENMNTGFAYHEVLVNDDNKPIDYRYIEANSQFEKLTGLKVSEIIGKTVTEVIPGIENDPADWIGKYGNVALTGEPLNAEDYSEALDRWYNVLGYSPKKRFFAVTFSDITDRKRAEKKLKESEEKYRHLYETSPYFIGLLDNKGILVDCNSSIYKFLSTHIKEDLIGKHFSEIFLLIERNEYLIPLFEKVFKDAINGKNTGPIDFQLYRSSGGYFWLNVQGSLIDLENQKLVQFFIQDISERKKAELIIQNEIKKLRELDELKNEFIIRTSHELNTPLVSICGSVEFLLNYIKEDFSKQSRAHLETINSGGKRLKQLVENLFDILRIESRKFELDVENISLDNIIKKCISDLNYLAKEREITISTSIQHEFYVKVDEVKIEQVFVNLLSNALKNTPHYGQISISSEEAQGYINTNITDTGTGFTEEEKTRIFEKFGKIEKYGKGMDIITEGPGLGLYLSKKIVELHGGKIWLESEGRNKGSTFIVSLPIDEK